MALGCLAWSWMMASHRLAESSKGRACQGRKWREENCPWSLSRARIQMAEENQSQNPVEGQSRMGSSLVGQIQKASR